ncbi:MAG: FAD-binding oxidoreductase [Acidobacteriota bacterium]
MSTDFRTMIEGYAEIAQELEICRKYGIDYSTQKGIWRESVERLHPKRLKLKISEILSETPHASTIRLVATSGVLPPFQAGQYINLFVEIDGIRTSRPYSISSNPAQTAYYDITIRRVANGFVSDYLLDRVKAGDILESTGPSGHFYHNPLFHGNDLVFIAGGSGITPIMSMIREFTDRGLDRNIHLIYGCRKPQDAMFDRELTERASRNSNLVYDLVVSEPEAGYEGLTGLINAGMIKLLTGGVDNKTFYLCGPLEMYSFCVPELLKLGVKQRRIRREVFGSPTQIQQEPAWPKEVAPDAIFSVKIDSREFPARSSESLLTAMERAGILLENCCRSGECSMCRVKLLSGQVFQAPGALVRKSDRDAGYIHSCVAYPISDLEVLA